MEKEIRIYDTGYGIVERDGEVTRTINGTAVVFNKDSQKLGWFTERIDPRAFDECDMSDVIACRNHDPDKVMARTSAKTLSLDIDKDGLRYSFEAPNTTVGNDTYEDIRLGNIGKSSFAFTVKEDKWEDLGDGNELRTITKINKLYDVSPVTNPAYMQTDVQANGLDVAKRSYEQWKEENKPEDDDNDDMAQTMSWREAKVKILSLR